MTDKQLLDRFLGERDEAAFEAIVRRHGATVLRICRGVLDDPHEVDDAFQATFVVLVRNATAIRDREALGPWLYEVAYRVSTRARSRFIKRRAEIGGRAVVAMSMAESDPASAPDPERRELVSLMQAEVARLPENFRAPIVSCYLEGRTHEEAARTLGLPLGTLKGRLRQGREILRSRLTRRGLAVSLALLLLLLRESRVDAGPIQVPDSLVRATVQAASKAAKQRAAASTLVPRPVILSTIAAIVIGSVGFLFFHRSVQSSVRSMTGQIEGDPTAWRRNRDLCDEPLSDRELATATATASSLGVISTSPTLTSKLVPASSCGAADGK